MTLTRTACWGVALVVVAPAVALAMLALSGSLATGTADDAFDSPTYAPYALAINRALRDLALAVTTGCLVLTASLRSPSAATGSDVVAILRRHLIKIARLAGLVWVATASADLLLTFTEVSGMHWWSPTSLKSLGVFVTDLPLGRNLSAHAIGAAAVSVGTFFVLSETGAFIVSILAVSALWPLGTTGHAAEDSGHLIAVYTQVAHIGGVSVWVGGLVGVTLLRTHLSARGAVLFIERYSSLAGVAAVLVGVSGLAAAWLRVGSWEGLTTAYGQIVLAKSAAFCLLLLAGYVHRRHLIPDFCSDSRTRRAFWQLVCGELATMTLAIGMAVALSRTATPNG